jgi:phage terminase small subunit
MAHNLTPKQERFVAEYLVDLNATQAAVRAGYSRKTASSQGERLLRNVEVSKAIKAGQKKRVAKSEITAERVLTELAGVGFGTKSDMTKVKALELIARHMGMLDDRLRVTTEQPVVIVRKLDRAAE